MDIQSFYAAKVKLECVQAECGAVHMPRAGDGHRRENARQVRKDRLLSLYNNRP